MGPIFRGEESGLRPSATCEPLPSNRVTDFNRPDETRPGPQEPSDQESDSDEPPQDLGFGSVVSEESTERLLNRDGSFNVRRKGLGMVHSLSVYHFLLDVTWSRFFLLVALVYVVINGLFAALYMSLGPSAFPELASEGVGSGFSAYFFFSVHTIATIGYGNVSPFGAPANVLVTVEALLGLLGFGLGAGLMFARIARPNARILFSDNAVIAPYQGIQGFEFRLANGRRNQLVELDAQVVMTLRKPGVSGREYHELSLERRRVNFFPLAWTVVHPIDEHSPMHAMRPGDLVAAEAEFLVLITGFEETFSQTVHARTSYRAAEILWNRRFTDIFEHPEAGEALAVDIGRLSETSEA